MAELEEIFESGEAFEDISGIDELEGLDSGLDDFERDALADAEAEAEEQFRDFDEGEIERIDANTPEEVQQEVNDAANDVEDLSDEQREVAEGENLDPDEPRRNLKTRLKKVWNDYGSFLKGVGKFSVKAVGEYFKWKFIIEVVGTVQNDINKALLILQKSKMDHPNSSNITLLTNFIKFMNEVNSITHKIDTPLKIITGASTTTDKDGLANLFANYFTLRASEDLTQTGTALLVAGEKVLLNNHNAYKALNLPQDVKEDDLSKITKATISSAIAKLSIADLDAFVKAAKAHQVNLEKYVKELESDDDDAKKLKAALTLPPKYAETFANLEAFISPK